MSGKKVREDVAENQQVNRDEEVKVTGKYVRMRLLAFWCTSNSI